MTITSDELNVKAEIFDMLGQSVFDAELHSGKNQISLQSFSNGVYYLKASKGNKSGAFKI
ncbi:T9SS type A sorting domain-containing protein [Cellulophaga sp. BC115SP]|nr:T9SS type A sorting domain-containing protein [Cellulophaga sp. BC115SP]